jgi:hypothetical protein
MLIDDMVNLLLFMVPNKKAELPRATLTLVAVGSPAVFP